MVVGSEAGAEGTRVRRPSAPCHPSPALAFQPGKRNHSDRKMADLFSTWFCSQHYTCVPVAWEGTTIPHPFTDEGTEAQLVIPHGRRWDLNRKPKL